MGFNLENFKCSSSFSLKTTVNDSFLSPEEECTCWKLIAELLLPIPALILSLLSWKSLEHVESFPRKITMNPEFNIYCTTEYLYLSFDQRKPAIWHRGTTCIVDTDETGSIFGMDIFVYEQTKINHALIQEQFSFSQNITVDNYGFVYIVFRPYSGKRGNGFGRGADIGVSKDGYLSAILFIWTEVGAAVPIVDPTKALTGINYTNGMPPFDVDGR